MKTLQLFYIFIISGSLSGQELKLVDTHELIHAAEKFGIDSVMHLASGFPIFQIDSITALQLVAQLSHYERYSVNYEFFNNMAHNWKNPF